MSKSLLYTPFFVFWRANRIFAGKITNNEKGTYFYNRYNARSRLSRRHYRFYGI